MTRLAIYHFEKSWIDEVSTIHPHGIDNIEQARVVTHLFLGALKYILNNPGKVGYFP